jgi:OOP family OmpA-OmpF porin
MDCVADFMLTHPAMFLTVAGYPDKNENNKKLLSEQRAKLVYDLLIKKGIDAKRMCYTGNGFDVPLLYQEFESNAKERKSKSRIEIQISETGCTSKKGKP